eukprot:10690421-Heterocapsa_arctica.AAC.1
MWQLKELLLLAKQNKRQTGLGLNKTDRGTGDGRNIAAFLAHAKYTGQTTDNPAHYQPFLKETKLWATTMRLQQWCALFEPKLQARLSTWFILKMDLSSPDGTQ